jgi:hypothetical protein
VKLHSAFGNVGARHAVPLQFAALAVFLSACVSFSTPYEERANVYNFVAVAEENDNDFSYPVTGAISTTGTLVYIPIPRKPMLIELFSKKKKKPLHLPSNDTEILVSGVLTPELLYRFGFAKLRLKYPSEYTPMWLINSSIDDDTHFIWDGEITFNDVKKNAQFDIYTYRLIGGDKLIEMINAKKPQSGMEFTYVVTDVDGVIAKPPFKWGKFISAVTSYGLYSGVETNYYATYPYFSKAEWEKEKWSPSSTNLDSYFKFFLKPGQKFQLVNKAGEVVAEIFGNTYTIYDTLPQSEWASMKQNMALFYVYRLIARRFFYSSDGGFSF